MSQENEIEAKKLSQTTDFLLSDGASCSAWATPKQASPEEGEWVLHTYAGVRAPEYGMYARGRFWRKDGAESFPTTHWLRIPSIDEPNVLALATQGVAASNNEERKD